MLNKFSVLFLVVAGSAVLTAADLTPEMQETATKVNVGRQEVEVSADKLVAEGNDLLSDKNYFEARDKYIEAKMVLQKYSAPLFAEKIEYCDRQIAKCYYEKASDAMNEADSLSTQSKYEEAIKICQEAIKYCPEQSAKLEKKIAYLEERRDAAIARDAVSVQTLLPNRENQAYQVELLMEQGRRLVAEKQYTKALRKFKEVLLITPYHSDAVQNIQMLNKRIGDIGLKRYNNTHRAMITESEWKYSIPLRPDANSSDGRNLLEDGEPKVKVEQAGDALTRKMESIVIPELNIEGDVNSVIKLFADLSRRYDPDKQGINFMLRRPAAKKAVRASSDNDESESVTVDVSTGSNGKKAVSGDIFADTYVNMDLRDKTLLYAVKQLCQQANLRYRVEKYAVVIAPQSVALDDLETKLFAVDIPKEKNMNEKEQSEKLKSLFMAAGVTFPDGAEIFYDHKISRLVAINTAENLAKIESELGQFDEKTPMIQVMVKFIEITQNDLDELAFNWQYGINSNDTVGTRHRDGSYELSSAMITRESSNELLRYYVPDSAKNSSDVISTPTNDAQLQYIWQSDDGTRISAQMFALNWADSSDVLYSPRVTTLDKQTAHIGMYTERYFPKNWNTADIENSENTLERLVAVDPQPELENLQKLGVAFEITPEIVDLKSGLIRIPIEFPIRTFVGYKVYDARSYDLDGNVDGEYYKMPIFNDRSVNTEVMLRDGETVILAGIATDISKIVHDKIPLLGDLPIVGRLFQSRYTDSQKGNLLIFLTARLVKSDGSAYNPAASNGGRGIPPFGRVD